MSKKIIFCLGLYFALLLVYVVFSYSLTAPNLILTSWTPYWRFQLYMWKTFFNDRELLIPTYAALISTLWLSYFWLIYSLNYSSASWRTRLLNYSKYFLFSAYCLFTLPLLFANNALSYDVFNYIFNAKMVAVYQANPHVKVALDYYYDDWTRFMHNTHTPAPYGYGWTALSLIPYYLGQEKFLLTWFLFRGFSLVSLWLLAWMYLKKSENALRICIVLFNPLVLLEIITNSHNDLWMMVPALSSLLLLTGLNKKNFTASALKILASIVLLAFSISMKLATIVLIPIWIILLLSSFFKNLPFKSLLPWWPVAASVLMFIPLLTLRSQQFHPWYLTWTLIWLPFFPSLTTPKPLFQLTRWWSIFLITLSVTSLYRYIPYFHAGNFDGSVLLHQKMITWSAVPISLIMWAIGRFFTQPTNNS
ncbi:MAG TPA: hypothetical protein VD999_04575 [Vitreimonas sp.]|nr:hypothetical protein [Vitreimonas sp.]